MKHWYISDLNSQNSIEITGDFISEAVHDYPITKILDSFNISYDEIESYGLEFSSVLLQSLLIVEFKHNSQSKVTIFTIPSNRNEILPD